MQNLEQRKIKPDGVKELYSGKVFSFQKEAAHGYEYITPKTSHSFDAVVALTAENPPRILIKCEHDAVLGCDLLKLPQHSDLQLLAPTTISPSVKAPLSTGLTSEHAELSFVEVNSGTLTDTSIRAVSLSELGNEISSALHLGKLVAPTLLSSITLCALRQPALFSSMQKPLLQPISAEDQQIALKAATPNLASDQCLHAGKFIQIREHHDQNGDVVEYASRPAGVIGAVIIPTVVRDEDGNESLVLAKQLRPPVKAEIYSHTAGLIGDKQMQVLQSNPVSAAEAIAFAVVDELWDEVGVVPDEEPAFRSLGPSLPGATNEIHFILPVRGTIKGEGGGAKNEGENIKRILVPFTRKGILDFISSNQTSDATLHVENSFLVGLACFLPELLNK